MNDFVKAIQDRIKLLEKERDETEKDMEFCNKMKFLMERDFKTGKYIRYNNEIYFLRYLLRDEDDNK